MNRYTAILLFISLLVAITWVGTNIFHAATQEQKVSSKLEEASASLDPNFDQDTLKKVKENIITGKDASAFNDNNPIPLSTPRPTQPSSIAPSSSVRPGSTPTIGRSQSVSTASANQ